MSSALAKCSACGHIFGERDALDPCPACGGTERTLSRQELDVDRSDPDRPTRVRRIQELDPDGSEKIVETPETP